jgi:hypothetical protein
LSLVLLGCDLSIFVGNEWCILVVISIKAVDASLMKSIELKSCLVAENLKGKNETS